jgi:hypothetical protein
MEDSYLTRGQVYARMTVRLDAIKKFAQFKGDGVLADKIRKLELDLSRLIKDEPIEMLSREVDNG